MGLGGSSDSEFSFENLGFEKLEIHPNRSVLKQLVTIVWRLGAISQLKIQIFDSLEYMWIMKQVWGCIRYIRENM